MKNECYIVRDLLPLYNEDMVSDETAVFVREHLEKCGECSAEFESMKSDIKLCEETIDTKEQRMQEAEQSGLVCVQQQIDNAESPQILANYLAKAIYKN